MIQKGMVVFTYALLAGGKGLLIWPA